MKKMSVILCAVACLAVPSLVAVTSAKAQDTTVVRSEGPDGSRTVVKRRTAYGTTKKVVRRSATGCRSKTVKRTNDMGDSVTKTKTSC